MYVVNLKWDGNKKSNGILLSTEMKKSMEKIARNYCCIDFGRTQAEQKSKATIRMPCTFFTFYIFLYHIKSW